jgi:3-oxoacyl-(acyl-carrier-protein) synthase
MAEDLLLDDDLDYCLVVAAEEADWLTCDAYRKWRLLRSVPPIEPFQVPPRGMILSEGAGAILIGREGPLKIERISSGTNFQNQRDAAEAVEEVFAELSSLPPSLISASANGTFIDAAERTAFARHAPDASLYAVKGALGESVGASSLWQTICAAQALTTQRVPPEAGATPLHRAVVSACGLNQQVAGVCIAI